MDEKLWVDVKNLSLYFDPIQYAVIIETITSGIGTGNPGISWSGCVETGVSIIMP
jgi:hypothetical protein